MLKIVRDITEFHAAGEVPGRASAGFPSADRVELRKKLISEEVGETLTAIDEGDLVEVADGIADSIVVLVGTALEFGIDLTAVWDEVHRSNMSKFPPCPECQGSGEGSMAYGYGIVAEGQPTACPVCNGRGRQLLLREDGKILKPESWTPPDIASLVSK